MPSEFGRLSQYTKLSHVSGSVRAKGTVTQATSPTTAVTLNKRAGVITTQALTGAANTATTFTLNNSEIKSTDIIHASLEYADAGAGTPSVVVDAIADGSCTINILNTNAAAALDAAAKVHFLIM